MRPDATADDRRRFFRIEDSVIFRYKVIPMDELPGRVTRLENGLPDQFTVTSDLAAIGQTMHAKLKRIEAKSPEVAAFLGALDEKINMLARAFLAQETEMAEQPACEVNISAAGMAFRAHNDLALGSMLELKIVLFPSYTGILTFGEVIRCVYDPDTDAEFPYDVAVDFAFIRDDDRDLLIKHVLGRQMDQLREKRLSDRDANPEGC